MPSQFDGNISLVIVETVANDRATTTVSAEKGFRISCGVGRERLGDEICVLMGLKLLVLNGGRTFIEKFGKLD